MSRKQQGSPTPFSSDCLVAGLGIGALIAVALQTALRWVGLEWETATTIGIVAGIATAASVCVWTHPRLANRTSPKRFGSPPPSDTAGD